MAKRGPDSRIYRVNLATGTQKETGLLIPFVIAILGTKFLTNSILVHQNSAQLRTQVIGPDTGEQSPEEGRGIKKIAEY